MMSKLAPVASMLLRGPHRARRLALLLAGLAAAAPAAAADSFPCGSKVVTAGMADAEVRAACGDPTEVRRDSILRRPTIWRQGRPVVVGDERVPVPVERWLYNFGPNQLMLRLRFDDGVLVEVETLGYGYNP
jgi:hypothetical protein